MRKILPLVVSILFLVPSCTSTSTNDSFLLKSLDDQSKAQALTNEGIQEYDLHLNHRQDLDQIPRIRQFFTVALNYDPANTQAQQYLTLIDNFKSQKLQANLNSATRALAKAKRTDDDNYALFVSLQTAARIDPADAKRAEDAGGHVAGPVQARRLVPGEVEGRAERPSTTRPPMPPGRRRTPTPSRTRTRPWTSTRRAPRRRPR